jgi:uncharacterized membrane protein YdcZ (DUF606 family)
MALYLYPVSLEITGLPISTSLIEFISGFFIETLVGLINVNGVLQANSIKQNNNRYTYFTV